MIASQPLGGPSRCGQALGPSLDKIVKNAAWRKHSRLVSTCKAVLDKLELLSDDPDSSYPLLGLSSSDAEYVLQPLFMAFDTSYVRVVEPSLECSFKLFSLGLACGQIDANSDNTLLFKLIESICKICSIGEEAIELSVLRVLLAAVRSPAVLIQSDCLLSIVRTCYNVYLGGLNGTHQICAKSVLAQIMLIIFTRAQEDSIDVFVKSVSVTELLEFTDKNLNEGSSIHFSQNFVSEVMGASEGAADAKLLSRSPTKLRKSCSDDGLTVDANASADCEKPQSDDVSENGTELSDGTHPPRESNIREDAFLLFRNLCKMSMKFFSQENPDDQIILRGKILSLELLKVIMGNASSVWRGNERFLSLVKQFLCLSLLKNSALSVMAIFQLQCSILMILLQKFRSGLKAEIGIFFPMLFLRVLENINQPSFIQKMTVLNCLEKMAQDSQILIDIFVNYDCDVDSPNIYERVVNGLHKTVLGPPPGSTTTLSSAQDFAFRYESVKCLVSITRSMGTWMDQKLKSEDSYLAKSTPDYDSSPGINVAVNEEDGVAYDNELHSDGNSEMSDAASLEHRRAYKIQLQKGVSLFNRKPSKGIEFLINTKKMSRNPEEVAAFLKSTSGLNETVIGNYLGERDEFCLRVMHAYVDSFNFRAMKFGEAIRFFLRGFRLPGEAQKIDRLMEKFAERYCKCNPNSFTSADTAYVLAYSVIMLNTDAHNNMVKDKMTKADFIRNNRGIDDGKDLPEEYLGILYDDIVKHEIKMGVDSSVPRSKHASSLNKLLGLDGMLNLVIWKQAEEKPFGADGLLIKHIQEQFKAKSGKSVSLYHIVTDTAILRFMVEVCWGPMLAAFSVTLDQSDDRLATSLCLLGFRHAVHLTAVMSMQTQRDAFVTSIAKFTYLHCAADMKQKNVDAVKAIIAIAIEDGNFLQEAWQHILMCLSRIEHLQLLGDGAPPDASFFTVSSLETDEKTLKSMDYPSLKKKGTLQNPAIMAVVRGSSYDNTMIGVNSPGPVTAEQINNFISNLNLLDQIGNFEVNHVFANSQRLNSDAIVAFVKALCKVSMSELQSPTDPRVFSLTKIVEIAHYNMNRIRLVWSRIWNVLSEFFVLVGLSENLSVAIFVMDSLRQLAMKFLDREELANYKFQNEFLRPFVIIMEKSACPEIRELIVRCLSQMVLIRVNNVKSGWKSVFMVFTSAAADEQKNIVLLAFETMEKIVREYFPYIIETERTTFTDCVRCLTAFTSSKFNSDVSLNAIAFLRFCATKLADGGLVGNEKASLGESCEPMSNGVDLGVQTSCSGDDNGSLWVPLLSGLSKLTFDPRSSIRKSALEVFFNILRDHGHHFSCPFWNIIFISSIFPIFERAFSDTDAAAAAPPAPAAADEQQQQQKQQHSAAMEVSSWDSDTCAVAVQCLVDIFVCFFNVVRSQFSRVVLVLTRLVKSSVHHRARVGIAGLLQLLAELDSRLSEDEWGSTFLELKAASAETLLSIISVLNSMDSISLPKSSATLDISSDNSTVYDLDDDHLHTISYVVSRVKSHIALQLLLIQVIVDLYKAHLQHLTAFSINILLDIILSIAAHARELSADSLLQKKLHSACSILELSFPPLLHFESESHQNCLYFLQFLISYHAAVSHETNAESQLVVLCERIFHGYLSSIGAQAGSCPRLPLGLAKREELAARSPLIVSAMRVLHNFEPDLFQNHVSTFFPLLVDLVRAHHGSPEVQVALSHIFQHCIGPLLNLP